MHYHQSYAKLHPTLFHKQPASPLQSPKLAHFNHALLATLTDLPFDAWDWQGIISGENAVFDKNFDPLAMVYAGHQFGQWAGQLGDGRGLLLAQVIDKQGKLTDLHLKGSGRTPFSRFGDGRAMIDSTVREYLGSCALARLGVPSSNALGFVVSDTQIHRHAIERAATLLRVSDCHIRLGHVEWLSVYAPELLPEFVYFMMDTYYPQVGRSIDEFLHQVCQNTAKLIAHWQLVGFSHGVMNTDNLNITGSTLDFGPFGMMERFDPAWINNHSDHHGRYTYQNQPTIAHWNLQKWLSCFALMSVDKSVMVQCLEDFERTFHAQYDAGICQKIGLPLDNTALSLAYEFVGLLKTYRLDYTNSFRALIAVLDNNPSAKTHTHEQQLLDTLTQEIAHQGGQASWQDWQSRYRAYANNPHQSINILSRTNPVYVLRNAMAQKAIDTAKNDEFNETARVFELLSSPFDVQAIATPDDTTPTDPKQMPTISCMS